MSKTSRQCDDALMPNYGQFDLEITSGKGAYVWTINRQGKRKKCLDLLCGLGVNSLGHCHPAVVKAINVQSKKIMHVSNLYATSPMTELAWELAGYDASKKVFFCNSGTEANEAAAKLARIWAHEVHDPQKKKIIALQNSFHGRTFMSISLTGQDKMQDKFAPGVPQVEFAELNNIDSLRQVVDHDVCAIIYETIQAEGGVHLMTEQFHQEIVDLSEEFQFLRIVDEVQTGVGRTGDFFSFKSMSNYYKYPHIITMAKALGGGLPIGAMIALNDLGKYLLPGSHAATFGGNPVVCAAALAVMKEIEKEKYCIKAHFYGIYFMDKLNAIRNQYPEIIKEVRGRGLMIGVELQHGFLAADVVQKMHEKGILIGTAGAQVVRFLPPFIITEDEIDKTLKKFEQVIKEL